MLSSRDVADMEVELHLKRLLVVVVAISAVAVLVTYASKGGFNNMREKKGDKGPKTTSRAGTTTALRPPR